MKKKKTIKKSRWW